MCYQQTSCLLRLQEHGDLVHPVQGDRPGAAFQQVHVPQRLFEIASVHKVPERKHSCCERSVITELSGLEDLESTGKQHSHNGLLVNIGVRKRKGERKGERQLSCVPVLANRWATGSRTYSQPGLQTTETLML